MTQLQISSVVQRRSPAIARVVRTVDRRRERRSDRARARLLVDAARVLPWPKTVIRDVVLGGVLAESIAALHVVDAELLELARRAQLLEDERQ